MTEPEAIASLVEIGDIAATYFSVWLSVTFAYLTVAYFLGTALSRFQCNAISLLYILIAAISGTTSYAYVESWGRLRAREATIFNEVWLFGKLSTYMYGIAVFLVFASALTLYFMYDVRKRS